MNSHPKDAAVVAGDRPLDELVGVFERAERATKGIALRWLLQTDIPLRAACVMLTLDPDDAPFTAREVAEFIGISVEDATHALHELRSLGYAREEKRRYAATEKGSQAYESLTRARLDALAAFASAMSDEDRRRLADSLTGQGHG